MSGNVIPKGLVKFDWKAVYTGCFIRVHTVTAHRRTRTRVIKSPVRLDL